MARSAVRARRPRRRLGVITTCAAAVLLFVGCCDALETTTPRAAAARRGALRPRTPTTKEAALRVRGGVILGGDGRSKQKDQMTNAITVTTLAGGAAQVKWPQWTEWGAKHGPSIISGQWWRLVTPALLHGSVVHLACNMFSLHSVGSSLEAWYGPNRFLAVYVAGAVAGNLVSTFARVGGISVGASGAIAGVVGALSVHHLRHRDLFGAHSDRALQSIGHVVLLNAMLGLTMGGIDNWAHLGGFIGGAAAGYVIGARYVPVRDRFGRLRGYKDEPLLRL